MAAAAETPEHAPEHARDYVGIALAYAKAAVADRKGKRFCKWVRLAAKRHLDDLKRARSDRRWPFAFDPWHGNDVCDFIEKLPHIEGQWDTATITLEPAQVFWLVCVFGWRRRSDGRRRFTNVYVEVARKNAKSTLTAGVVLYCFTCEGEPAPYVFIGATTGAQAQKVFHPARMMAAKTPAMCEAFGLTVWAKSITEPGGGYIQTITSKASSQDGHNPHVGVLDELHAHRDRALHDVIRSAFGARKAPLFWKITTAGFNTNGVCYEQRRLITKILEGARVADHYFGIIYTLDTADDYGDGRPDDDPFDESTWGKANPLLGVSVQLDELRGFAIEAQASPESEGEFKTKRLNMWLNAASAWLNMARWLACADPSLAWEDFDGLDCYVGCDLADKDDITALVLAAFDAEGRLLVKPVFYLPEAILAEATHAEGEDDVPYRTWAKEKHLRLTPGDWVDHNEVERQIVEWIERFAVRHVTGDQFSAFQAMAVRLNERFGSPDRPIASILHKNAKSVTDPAKDLEARVKSGPKRFRHDGNPVLNWMASNAVVSRYVNGTIIPKKETPMSANKIDGIDAAINAIAPVAVPGEPDTALSIPENYEVPLL
ncbi:MAG TPA: terminase TerL endonuclease subunit [Azospirillum sp.]